MLGDGDVGGWGCCPPAEAKHSKLSQNITRKEPSPLQLICHKVTPLQIMPECLSVISYVVWTSADKPGAKAKHSRHLGTSYVVLRSV